jgi:superoxide dismutase, Fe-Mn family
VTTYSLPDLPYDYGALAPHIAGEIMELHHSKHHQTYVGALNQTLDKLADARDKGDFGAIVGLEKTLAFNLGGHVNHSTFWTNLSPDGGDKPTGELAAALDEHFGSTPSRPTSPPPPPPSRAPAGPSSAGTPSAGAC